MRIEGMLYNQYNICNKEQSIANKTFQIDENIQKQKKVLGIGFLNAPSGNISYGMRAEYAEASVSNEPIIKVTIQTVGSKQTYYVDINHVDAKEATEVEMFALCCYADDIGKGVGGNFGTWQTLNYYRANASDIGKFDLSDSLDSCLSLRQDWLQMIDEMKKLYIKAGYYKQSLDGNLLMKCLT